MNMNRASISVTGEGHYVVEGELDMNSVPQLWRSANGFFNTPATSSLVFDLQAVTRSDSSGLALLIEWMALARQNNQTIHFRNLPVQMWEIAKVSDLVDVIPLEK